MYKAHFKRIFDVVLAVIAGVFLIPIVAIILMISFVVFKGKVLFCQKRLGMDHKVFTILKFRTMYDGLNDNYNRSEVERIPPYGQFLRKYSLDEIPQLINILKGDLSFVGPRPLLVEYLNYFTEQEKTRHSVKPGLTGLAQINGRNSIQWHKRFEFDLQYIKQVSFAIDFKILFKTLIHFFRGQQVHFSTSLIEERKMVALR